MVMKIRESVEAWLRDNRLGVPQGGMQRPAAVFLEEMGRGLAGQASSLEMIPTYIATDRAVPTGQRVIALDAGGTNLRVAVVSFAEDGKPVVEGLSRHRMPGTDAAMDRDGFFDALASFVTPLADRAGRIGFCFSYPVAMRPDQDGRLIRFTKDVKARGVEGELIGANLAQAMGRCGAGTPERIVLLNDTVTTLLAGRNAAPGRRFDGHVGLVCGTGFNCAYVESNGSLSKVSGLAAGGSMIVNTESGSYGLGPTGPVDDEFDSTTGNPGKGRFEKMISGGYLGGLSLATLRRAGRDGLLSAAARGALEALGALSTRDVNAYLLSAADGRTALGALCEGLPEADAVAVYLILDSLVERAAWLVALNLSAVILKTGQGLDPRFPVCLTVDGTTFWHMSRFRLRVESHMRAFLQGREARSFEILAADDAPLIGAAIAALTN